MEENVHLARSQAQHQLDRYAIQQMVGGRLRLRERRGPRPGCSRCIRAACWRGRGADASSSLGQVEDKLAGERHSYEERMRRAPEILVRLRSHTVWERMSVKLCFTVQGFPTPVVQW